ncbi:MAG: DUF1302 domain-containing protein [Pelovirga sp.]
MNTRSAKKRPSARGKGICQVLWLLVPALLFCAPVSAVEFRAGEIRGNIDTTLSYGAAWRMKDQDSELIGIANGGKAYSLNYDDGNLNYDKGDLISHTAKITSEMALQYRNFSLFVRGTAFYDFENNDGTRARTPLSSDAKDMVGKDITLLDAYLTWDFDIAEKPAQLRVGNQVLSWGESTFIQNGINVINPVDVSKLRVAGAELREGLIPVGMVSASISPTENISFEGFYQYDWQETKIDPTGSYWSTNDFAGDGGQKVMLGFGDVADQGDAPASETLLAVPRASNVYADDSGQYGFAMRVFAPGLNETEFGFYFMNYHSRLPVLSSQTGNLEGLTAAGTISTVTPDIVTSVITNGGDPTTAIATYSPVIGQNAALAIAGTAAQAYAASSGDIATTANAAGTVARAFATDAYAKTARYKVEYPEDIKLYGVSFNTLLQNSGIALQGEISHKRDVPLQLDDIELLLATLEPLTIASADQNGLTVPTSYSQFDKSISPTDIFLNGGESIYIQGYELFDVTQTQMTATKLFGPTFGASQFTLVGEVGLTHVHNMPSKSDMRLDGPGTPVSGNPEHTDPSNPLAAHPRKEYEPSSAFADATSWGYRVVAKLDFNNAIGAVTLSPRVAWAHDVEGTTPGPGGNFVEGRKAVTLGLGANYQNKWAADISYTDFFGAGRYNLINDRDFLAAEIKYYF